MQLLRFMVERLLAIVFGLVVLVTLLQGLATMVAVLATFAMPATSGVLLG